MIYPKFLTIQTL